MSTKTDSNFKKTCEDNRQESIKYRELLTNILCHHILKSGQTQAQVAKILKCTQPMISGVLKGAYTLSFEATLRYMSKIGAEIVIDGNAEYYNLHVKMPPEVTEDAA